MKLFIQERELEKIVLAYQVNMQQMVGRSRILIQEQIDRLNTRLLLNVHQNIKNKDGSKRYECLYYHSLEMKELIQKYHQKLGQDGDLLGEGRSAQSLRIVDQKIAGLLEDISGESDNPITYERMVMISGGVLKIKQLMMETLSVIEPALLRDHLNEMSLMDYMEGEVQHYYERLLGPLETIIENTMSNLAIKEEANRQLKLLEEIDRAIEPITQMDQANFYGDLSAQALEVAGSLRALLDDLHGSRMSMQLAKEAWDAKTTQVTEIVDAAAIEQLVKAHLFVHSDELKMHIQQLESIQQSAMTEMTQMVEGQLEQATATAAEQIVVKRRPFRLLSQGILEVLSSLTDEVTAFEVSPDGPGERLLKAIQETLHLKLEGLKEEVDQYELANQQVAAALEATLQEVKNRLKEQAQTIFEAVCREETEPFYALQQRFNQAIEQHKQGFFKKDIQYLRDVLLAELRTLEEMRQQSVSKYGDMGGPSAHLLQESMDQALEAVNQLLNHYHLEPVQPSLGDSFNGKEHEALLVKEAQDYKQGQIIELKHAGYKLDETMIIRASVIVAK